MINTLVQGVRSSPRLAPGALICALIAVAAAFISAHYGESQLIYLLLIALSFFAAFAQTPEHGLRERNPQLEFVDGNCQAGARQFVPVQMGDSAILSSGTGDPHRAM
jgi:hypothetical protein